MNTSNDAGGAPPPASAQHERLQLAMSLADKIRKQFLGAEEEQWFGVPEGLFVATLCLGVSLRIRSGILRWAGSRYGLLPDLIVSPLCAVVPAQAGLWVGTLTGARRHLDRVPRMQRNELDTFCRNATAAVSTDNNRGRRESVGSNVVASSSSSSSFAVWDPQAEALQALARALKRCDEDALAKESVEQFYGEG